VRVLTGCSPYTAIYRGLGGEVPVEVIEELLQYGARVNPKILCTSLAYSTQDTITCLLEHLFLQITSSKDTNFDASSAPSSHAADETNEMHEAINFALLYACCQGLMDVVTQLIEIAGADVNFENTNEVVLPQCLMKKDTPLAVARRYKAEEDVIQYLIDKGADPLRATDKGYYS